MCFRRLSRPSVTFSMFREAQPSKVCYGWCFKSLGRAKALYSLCMQRPSRATHGIYCVFGVFEGSADQSMILVSFGRLSRAKFAIYGGCKGSSEQKHCICYEFEGSAEQSMVFLVFPVCIMNLVRDSPADTSGEPSIYYVYNTHIYRERLYIYIYIYWTLKTIYLDIERCVFVIEHELGCADTPQNQGFCRIQKIHKFEIIRNKSNNLIKLIRIVSK